MNIRLRHILQENYGPMWVVLINKQCMPINAYKPHLSSVINVAMSVLNIVI